MGTPFVTAFTAVIVFSLLVFFHELGHFGIAKLVGIKVHEFAIGMGPKLLKFRKNETDYTIRILPIGGYVKMEGEDEASNDINSFSNKGIVQRISVILAGPIMNFILGILLFTIIFYTLGTPSTTINKVIERSPAEAVGIEAQDKIIEIDGKKIRNWNQLVSAINDSEGKQINIILLRDGNKIEKKVVPQIDENTSQSMIGIFPQMQRSFTGALRYSFNQTKMLITEIFSFLKRLIAREATSSEVVGPVGIINLVGEATRAGWLNVMFLAALISINLGIMNLLPIPALDGSRIIFLLLELLRGKPIDPEKEGMVHLIGFGLLMLLMIVVTYQDILTFFITK